MTNFLLAWWPLFLLLHLPWIVNRVAHIMFARTQSRLDHETPDTLPETAGQWLERKTAALGLAVKSIVTDSRATHSHDAFYPTELTIQLTEDVYFKRDPAYWAIAAHELGHARFRIGRPKLWAFLHRCERLEGQLVSIGLAMGLGNMLYGLPHLTNAAFVILAIALALHVAKIVNEMIASAFAFAALEQEVHVTRAHLRTIRIILALALSTYLASFVGHALLLGAWSLVESNTAHAPHVLGTLTTFGRVMAVVWSVVIGLTVVGRFFRVWERNLLGVKLVFLAAQILTIVAIPGLLWLLWDARPEAAYAYCVMLAAVPGIRLIVGGASVVFSIPFMIARRFFREAFAGIEGRGVERSDVFLADVEAGRALTAAGNREVERIVKTSGGGVSWGTRLGMALMLPLLILYWVL